MILKMPPTKSNLFKLQSELKFAKDGYELLDRELRLDFLGQDFLFGGVENDRRSDEDHKLGLGLAPDFGAEEIFYEGNIAKDRDLRQSRLSGVFY